MSIQGKILIGFILTLIIVVFIPVYWAMEPRRQEAALIRQQTEAAQRGAELYSSFCSSCHGIQGEGFIAPALKGTQLDDGTLQKVITRGVPGTVMPAWGKEDGGPFHQQNLSDLVTFIKNWDSASGVEPGERETPPAEVNAGALFSGKCASCHGVNREGTSGFAPPLTPESLSKLSDEEIRETISNGRQAKGMPSFKNTLSPEEIESLIQLIKYTSP